ncbi:metal-dependent hydrolase family protein [Sphingosinicella sp. LY1275]|uniref:metal-dependent hydrolase family protein n=1 Tax=Sphingosinicella sp. LY1275 TaxID=3095379 RepID=UPI002ADEDB1B|nr:amidohydrolase family protein [Sphingosinicella sp. LY1275]MEA1015553.1 amidohydrolase family protein [Sphingosinicella sp. LY1275]
MAERSALGRSSRGVVGLLLALGLAAPALAAAEPTARASLAIHAGAVVAVPGERALGPTTIIVRDGRIAEISPGYVDVAGVPTVDLKTRTLLPGLIDTHVHFSFAPETKLWSAAVDTPEDVALFAFSNAKKTLEAGFTTVRDVGSDGDSIHALRDAVNEGTVTGPRIFLSGTSLSIVGGHGDMSGLNRRATEALFPYDYTGACTGAVECALRVREAAKYGADLIKITSTGGIMSQQARGLGQHLSDEELTSIVTTAHSLGLKVAAHAHGREGVIASVRAGVDSIEHGTYLDDETAKLMAKRGTWLVPTLGLLEFDGDEAARFTPAVRAKIADARRFAGQNIRLAVKYKLNVAFGTDAGVSPHGKNARQFRYMVEQGPMTPAEALRAATVSAAELLGQSDKIGTIEVGKLADLIAVDGDPYEDVTLLEAVAAVIKGGEVIKHPADAPSK